MDTLGTYIRNLPSDRRYNGVHPVLTHPPTNGNVMPTAVENSTTFRAVTFRLYPRTAAKHNRLMRVTGACVYVWNHFLAKNRREYGWHKAAPSFGMNYSKPPVTFFSLGKQFTELRRETDWLQELPFAPVRYALKHQADAAGTVAVEDLNVKGMTRSAKGTADDPGSNIRQKAGLNRSILNTGWGQLRQMLEYKASNVIAVNPAHTSQTCRACGAVEALNRTTQSRFHCVHCGHEANADINAALNILALGTGAAGQGGGVVGRPGNCQNVARLAA